MPLTLALRLTVNHRIQEPPSLQSGRKVHGKAGRLTFRDPDGVEVLDVHEVGKFLETSTVESIFGHFQNGLTHPILGNLW